MEAMGGHHESIILGTLNINGIFVLLVSVMYSTRSTTSIVVFGWSHVHNLFSD